MAQFGFGINKISKELCSFVPLCPLFSLRKTVLPQAREIELNGLEHGFVFCLQEVWVWSLAPHSEVHKTKSCLPELYNLNLKAFTKWNKASACTFEKGNIAKKASGLVKISV